METGFGLVIKWNRHNDDTWKWDVQIPGQFKNQICGLCGKWDGDKTNDFQLPLKPGQKTAGTVGTFRMLVQAPQRGYIIICVG